MATITLFNPLTDEIFPVSTAGFDARFVNITGDVMTGDLTIQPAVNSATALRVNQADGTNILVVDTINKAFEIIGATSLIADTATSIPLLVKGAAGQTASLQEWQDSGGSILAQLEADGDFTLANHNSFNIKDTDGNARIILQLTNADMMRIGPAGSPAGTTTSLGLFPGTTFGGHAPLTLYEGGEIVFNDGHHPDVDVRMEGDTDQHLFMLNAGNEVVTIGGDLSTGKFNINGTLFVNDKVMFTQTDGNEYIDSLADGYMDYGATTAHRFNTDKLVVLATGNIGAGCTPATSAKLELSSTVGALLLTRMTTVQRDALTAVNGMVLYNTNNNRLEAYENGAWVDL